MKPGALAWAYILLGFAWACAGFWAAGSLAEPGAAQWAFLASLGCAVLSSRAARRRL